MHKDLNLGWFNLRFWKTDSEWVCTLDDRMMKDVMGKPDTDEIRNQISRMDSESIRLLVNDIWLLYDDAVLRETGHLYNLGEGDPHWEGHL